MRIPFTRGQYAHVRHVRRVAGLRHSLALKACFGSVASQRRQEASSVAGRLSCELPSASPPRPLSCGSGTHCRLASSRCFLSPRTLPTLPGRRCFFDTHLQHFRTVAFLRRWSRSKALRRRSLLQPQHNEASCPYRFLARPCAEKTCPVDSASRLVPLGGEGPNSSPHDIAHKWHL